MDVYQLIKDFAPENPDCEGLKFDFTWLMHYGNPQAWSVLSLTNSAKQAQILSKLSHGFSYEQFLIVVLDALMSCKTFETDFDIYNRGQAFKLFLKEYLSNNPLPVGEKLAVVCHSKFICSLTSTHVNGIDEDSEMVNFKWLNNC